VIINGFDIQDTIKKKIVFQDSVKQLADTSDKKSVPDSSLAHKAVYFQPVKITEVKDTTSICIRNRFSDVTFSDSSGIMLRIDGTHLQDFPYLFTELHRKRNEEIRSDLVKHLRSGNNIPPDSFHNDWALPVILFSVLIYGTIKGESARFFRAIFKFISFRGINENKSRDMGSFIQWQSILVNLASFINISLFAFITSVWYEIFPFDISSVVYWLILFLIIISAFTFRHLICIITGNISGEKEVFREYLSGIYQAYRLAGLLLLILTTLILYTSFMPVNVLIYAGFSLIALIYFIRVIHLFLIFINRHVSIFYLILYLCALEILPVVILVKYVTGLV
jgi:hypothetical protein